MGVRLRRLREEQRLTQAALAAALGLSPSYLNQLENNQRPLTVPVLLKLNRAYGLDVQVFSDDDEAVCWRRCVKRVWTYRTGKRCRRPNCVNSHSTCRPSRAC